MWISCSWTFSRRPDIDSFSHFIDNPLLSCSCDFNTHGDWPSELPAYVFSQFFPYPLPLCLYDPCPAQLWSHSQKFSLHVGLYSGRRSWLVIFKSSQELPSQPLYIWPGHPALSHSHSSSPSVHSTSGVKLFCYHAVEGTSVGALGQVYYFPCLVHTDQHPKVCSS